MSTPTPTPTPITEAHKATARSVIENGNVIDGAQIIADCEMQSLAAMRKKCDHLRAARDSDFELFHAFREKLIGACQDIINSIPQGRTMVKRPVSVGFPFSTSSPVAQKICKNCDAPAPTHAEVIKLRDEVDQLTRRLMVERKEREREVEDLNECQGQEAHRAECAEAELRQCFTATGADVGDMDDFKSFGARRNYTVAAVREMRRTLDNAEAELKRYTDRAPTKAPPVR